jgi:predicted metal-binding membrane protein
MIIRMSPMYQETQLEALFKRDRAIVISGIVGISGLAWAYMFYMASVMNNMEVGIKLPMPQMQSWAAVDFVLIFVMWSVMMVAMMVPSAAPMVLMFTNINRKRREQQNPFVPTGVFLLGYLVAWIWYSALATLAQWGLNTAALLSPMMVSTSPIVGGVLLLATGLFQFTSLKHACLTRCRSPLGFLLNEWRDGTRGAFIMGLRNGNYCVVCCWALMSLMFVAGVMSLLWMAIIAVFVLVEKVAPKGVWISRVSGLLFIVWGIWMLVGALG